MQRRLCNQQARAGCRAELSPGLAEFALPVVIHSFTHSFTILWAGMGWTGLVARHMCTHCGTSGNNGKNVVVPFPTSEISFFNMVSDALTSPSLRHLTIFSHSAQWHGM